jgi:hypothetical protein
MSLDTTNLWHKRARPNPTDADFNVQLGCHAEEFVEMLGALHFTHPKFGTSAGGDMTLFTLLGEFADELKANRIQAAVVDRKEFLDSLADQIVTAVGVGHCANMDVPTALERVSTSNWSKTVDGEFIRDANGKIAKPATYVAPDLEGLY